MVSKLPHYVVVGGGLSGLSTAYFLSLAKPVGSCRITVLENSNRWGGWIQSVKSPKTGSVYELGPHSARASSGTSNLLLRLVLDLGLRNSLLWISRNQDAGRQLIFTNNQIVPVSFLNPSTSQPLTRSLLALVFKRIVSPRPPRQEDCSVDEFLRTRLDGEFADSLGSALMRGIYGGDSRRLSARACIPSLVEAEERGPNLILGLLRSLLNSNKKITPPLPSFIDSRFPKAIDMPPRTFAWSLSAGMQALPDALVEKLENPNSQVNLHLNSCVTSIKNSSNRFEVNWMHDSDPKTELADAVFMCCPSYKAAKMLDGSISPDLLKLLDQRSTPWTDIVAVALELAPPADPPIRGFGHLVPLKEDPYILGMVYDSIALPSLGASQDAARYTVMMKTRPEWLEPTSSADEVMHSIQMAACDAIKQQLQISNPVILDQKVAILRNCIPQYAVGHKKRIMELRNGIQKSVGNSSDSVQTNGLHFVGYSYDGVGLNDIVHSALNAVSRELKLN